MRGPGVTHPTATTVHTRQWVVRRPGRRYRDGFRAVLGAAGVPAGVVDVFAAISRQEANHNVSGYRWLKLLDTGSDRERRRLAEIVCWFLEAEPLPEADGSSRSQRKHFPFYLVDCYRRTGDFLLVKREIVAASRSARHTGLPGVPIDRLYAHARDTSRWAETMGARS